MDNKTTVWVSSAFGTVQFAYIQQKIDGLYRHLLAESSHHMRASKYADVQELLVVKEEVPREQSDPEPPHIKVGQKEQCISREADITTFTFMSVPVERENDEENPFHQRAIELMNKVDGDECGGPEPTSNLDPDGHLQPVIEEETEDSSESKTEDSSESETEDSSESETEDSSKSETEDSSESETEDGNTFFSKELGRKHTVYHIEERSYSCSLCGESFNSKSDLYKHNIRTHTGEQPFKCLVCDKSFVLRSCLHKHRRTHTGEKPFTCSVCKKGYSKRQALKIHLRIHTGEKPYSCSVCKKCFGIRSQLQRHMRTHTGEKPYSCSVCSKGFSQRGALQMHMYTHTEDKPWSCSVCKKSFAVRANLQVHMRTHTGEKPYSCSVCTKSFSQKPNLQKHMGTHTRTFRATQRAVKASKVSSSEAHENVLNYPEAV